MKRAEIWNLADLPVSMSTDTVKAKRIPTDDQVTIHYGVAAAGASFGDHAHEHDQWILVTRGAGRMICDGEVLEMRVGSVLRIRAGTVHSAIYDEEFEALEFGLGRVD